MSMKFSKATKYRSRLRAALIGPSGSGKTYTALRIATELVKLGAGSKVAVIDTERGSASKYADLFSFDVLELETFSPMTYVQALEAAVTQGYDVVVIDSLSHAWMGKDGALEQVDRAAKRDSRGNSFAAWRDVTPKHNALVDAMVQCGAHLIATMRSKTEYVVEQDAKGRSVPRKVGTAPVQRDGLEYEFDLVGEMNLQNELIVSKTRCPALTEGVFAKPGPEVAKILAAWLDGTEAPANKPKPVTEDAPTPLENALRATVAANEAKKAARNGNGSEHRNGNGKAMREQIADYFKAKKVPLEDVEGFVGNALDSMDDNDIKHLRKVKADMEKGMSWLQATGQEE